MNDFRHILTVLTASVAFMACTCYGDNEPQQQTNRQDTTIIRTVGQESADTTDNLPQAQKLIRTMTLMSDRFLGDFYGEFLSDLQKLLETEKRFPQDDISLYYLIDKRHDISSDYKPTHLVKLKKNDDYRIKKNNMYLREDVEAALRVMAKAAKADGVDLVVISAYRSYNKQKGVFKLLTKLQGLKAALRTSARPGQSQHRLGVAVDFGSIENDFSRTKSCKWLLENASKYGWSLSFPQGYEDVTGYRYECWHYRYIGVEACEFQKKWFNDIQQYMLEFIDAWKNAQTSKKETL